MTQTLRRGRASDANLAASMASECFQELPDGYSQYDLVRLVENNGKEIGVGPAAMAHYRFLVIRWTQDRDWCEPGERPIVFLRVDRTAEERSLSEARVRQLEYELNEAGLLTWTDRGDYHRSGTRDAQGRILFAHGVDLSPGAVMLPKLLEIDARRRGELKERAGFRARISRLKGYVRPRLARAIENGLTDPDDAGWRNGTEMLKTKTNGATPLERLQEIAMNLSRLGDALNRLFSADSLDGENNDAGCGKARKTCERTRKPIGASIENYRPIYTTRDSKTDKSVTSTSACGQSTACGGETDAPCGAKSSVETVDGREKGEFSLETKQEPRERDNSANAERDRGWGRARTAVDALARNLREGGDAGETGRAKRSNGTCLQSRELGAETMREEPPQPGIEWKRGRGRGGGSWKPNPGTRHISPLNAVEVAGPRFRDSMPRTDHPDWREIEDAAERLCPQLGIGSQVWWVAVTVMGRRAAAICVMLIDRRMCPDVENSVRCPGAYLRGMTDRARDDKLRLHASVFG